MSALLAGGCDEINFRDKREFEQAGELELPALFAQYESDARNGVTTLLVRYRKQLAKLSAERNAF